MSTVQADIVIARPPEVIFSWLGDLARHRQFVPDGWIDYRVTTPQASGKGARARFRAHWIRGDAPLEVEIVEIEHPDRLVQRSTKGEITLTWTLARQGGGTRVALQTEYAQSDGLLGRLLSPLVTSSRLRGDCQQTLERLKALCEGSER
ncbi:MAG: SRPBCC family protein [Anaerolineae bacterium]|nr:SRPBCC family protein [Anaerolineae bacterium]